MKHGGSPKEIYKFSKKLKTENILESILKMKYVIFNRENIFEPINNLLSFSLYNVEFEIGNNSDLFSNFQPIAIPFRYINCLCYSPSSSLISLTLHDKFFQERFADKISIVPNTIWFCLDVNDVSEYTKLYETLIARYSDAILIESLSNDIYEKFMSKLCYKSHDNLFINDWSNFVTSTVCTKPRTLLNYANKDTKLVYMPGDGANAQVNLSDLLCLRENQCLNDRIINFYMLYIYHEIIEKDQRDRYHIFNLFFYTKLIGNVNQQMTDTPDKRYFRVQNWTKKIDLFDKDFILIPIIEDGQYFLIIVCFPWMAGMVDYCKLLGSGEANIPPNDSIFATVSRVKRLRLLKQKTEVDAKPCILMFDSLVYDSQRVKVDVIRDYLMCEWDAKRAMVDGHLVFDKSTCRGFRPEVPCLQNFTDSGIYMLLYAEMFYKRPFKNFDRANFHFQLLKWFDNATVKRKRKEIQKLIMRKFNLGNFD